MALAWVLAIVNLAVFRIPAVDCAVRFPVFDQLLFASVAPMAVLAVVVAIGFWDTQDRCHRHTCWPSRQQQLQKCVFGGFVRGWSGGGCTTSGLGSRLVVYPQVSSTVRVRLVHCKTFRNGTQYLGGGRFQCAV